MPNHCSNSLNVRGPGTEDFFKKVASFPDDNFVSEFIPMPNELKSISTGGNTIDGVHVTKWREIDGKAVAISDIDTTHMIDVYGTDDWYVWAQQNWGTKWGSYDVDVNPDSGRILFDSAWAPPAIAIETISKMFPRATFTHAYAEGGSCYWGTTVYRNGDVVDTHESNEFWNDKEYDDDDYAIEDHLTPECAAHLEKYGLHTGG